MTQKYGSIPRDRYELLIRTADWWAMVNGDECPLFDGQGMPKVVNSDLEIIEVSGGTRLYQKIGQEDKNEAASFKSRRVLNFTQRQLEFLIIVSEGEDWHPTAFADVVAEDHQEGTFPKHALTNFEFEGLRQELKRLSVEKIADLQAAINYLGSL